MVPQPVLCSTDNSTFVPLDSAKPVFRCVYFFAGPTRKGDVKFWLQEICSRENLILDMCEFDLLRSGTGNDLSAFTVQEKWVSELESYNAVINTPPCSTYSRAPWANSNGPVPIRNVRYPLGFPWLSNVLRAKAANGNALVEFFWKTMLRVNELQGFCNITAFGEHPEDLGRVAGQGPGNVPASIWQSKEFAFLLQQNWWSAGFQQSKFGAPTAKPTRGLSNSATFTTFGETAPPSFDEQGYYQGPIPKSVGIPRVSLLRKRGDVGPFRTESSATYPSDMCRAIAEALVASFLQWRPTAQPSGGDLSEPGPRSAPVHLPAPAPFPPLPPSVAPVLKFSFSGAQVELLKDKLLKVKVDTMEMVDPAPCNVAGPSCEAPVPLDLGSGVPEQVLTPPTSVLRSNKWELTCGQDYVVEGWWGVGEPIRTQKTAGRFGRHAFDGGGLCCPGRWTQSKRILPPAAKFFTDSIDRWLDIHAGAEGESKLEKIVYGIMAGRFLKHPFEGLLGDLKYSWAVMLEEAGHARPPGRWKNGQTIDFGFLHQVGAYLQDPDFSAMKEFVNGVRIGVDVLLPRTPAVWPPKTKWPLGEYGEDPVTELNDNYPSVKQHRAALLLEMQDQIKRGWAIPMKLKNAVDKYGPVSVASLAVLEEKPGKLRTLLDASNRVQINHRIHVVDAEVCPSALDVQGVTSADELLQPPILALVIDIEKAHQQVPVAEEDWRHVGCSADPMPSTQQGKDNWDIILKTVGTYGVASASWQWSRVASLFQRICYYICALSYLFRFADDFMLLACNVRGIRFTRPILRFIVLLGVFDFPLKWGKTRGGIRAEFVGYLFHWDTLQGGLSERRCSWITGWLRKTADIGAIVTRELRGGLGRISFSSALLRFLLPFLGPLYAWVAVSGDGSVWPLPPALLIILRWLADQIEKNPLVTLRHLRPVGLGRYFKADARAEGEIVQVGGFEVVPGSTLKSCRWFSFVLTPATAPWAFVRENQAYRAIAALELFATVLCVMLFVDVQITPRNSVLYFSGVTDNQGNEALVHKSMSSKFPLYIVLLELVEQLQSRGIKLDLRWQKREFNEAADRLSNGLFEDFDASNRLNPLLSDLDWKVLPSLLAEALKLETIIRERKAQLRCLAGTEPKRLEGVKVKKRKLPGLRVTDPW